jgi:tetratricopeptide (TPR) repeat protein
MDGHIPDVELSLYAHDPESFPQERSREIERHTASCAECGASLDFYSVAEEDLHDPAVWQPIGATMAALMTAYAHRCAAEDAEADRLLEPYVDNPVRAAWADLRRRREFHTGGVVRRLNARAHAIVASEPLDALTYADLAQMVAEILPDDTYPNNAVYELRGTAWKERANALVRLGNLDEALESLRRAERAYGHLRSSGQGLAAVELVRAAVYYQLDQLETAAMHAERAEHGYAHLGQNHRRIKALHLRGSIRYLGLDLDTAAAIFQQVIDFGDDTNDLEWIAKGSYSRANCELDRGNLAEASMLFHRALVIFREFGPATDRICTDWGLARVVLHGGKAGDAARRFREVMFAFEELGMVMDAAIVGLDLADALLVLEQPKQIAKVAAHSFHVLKKAGVMTYALAALAYLKEAATAGRLSPEVIRDIRTFLRRTEREPGLIFIAPPCTSD